MISIPSRYNFGILSVFWNDDSASVLDCGVDDDLKL